MADQDGCHVNAETEPDPSDRQDYARRSTDTAQVDEDHHQVAETPKDADVSSSATDSIMKVPVDDDVNQTGQPEHAPNAPGRKLDRDVASTTQNIEEDNGPRVTASQTATGDIGAEVVEEGRPTEGEDRFLSNDSPPAVDASTHHTDESTKSNIDSDSTDDEPKASDAETAQISDEGESTQSPSRLAAPWDSATEVRNQELCKAIVDGNFKKFMLALNEGADIQAKHDDEDEDGDKEQSTIFLAARYGRPRIARMILRYRSDKDFLEGRVQTGWAAVHIAAQNDSLLVLRHLLKAHADVNATNLDGSTPLLLAARNGRLSTVRTLLKSGADIKIMENDGETALHTAAENGHDEVLELLLEHDDGKALVESGALCQGWSILHNAAKGSKGSTVRMLIDQYKADLMATTTPDSLTALHLAAGWHNLDTLKVLVEKFESRNLDLMAKDADHETALHSAASYGHLAIVEYLASKTNRTGIISETKSGETALSVAAKKGYDASLTEKGQLEADAPEEKWIDVVLCLLDNESYLPPSPEFGVIPETNRREVQEVERFLLKELEDPNPKAKVQAKMTRIVHWAVFHDCFNLVKRCFQINQDIGLKTKNGETLLHIAASNGVKNIVEILLSRFKSEQDVLAEVNNAKALHFAASNGHKEILDYLLKRCPSMDHIQAKTENGETPLYLAAKNGHHDVVSRLLSLLKADGKALSSILEATDDGKTPLLQAVGGSHKRVFTQFLQILSIAKFGGDVYDALIEVARAGQVEAVQSIYQRLSLPKKQGLDDSQYPNQKSTALHWAVCHGHYVVVWWLLAKGGPALLKPLDLHRLKEISQTLKNSEATEREKRAPAQNLQPQPIGEDGQRQGEGNNHTSSRSLEGTSVEIEQYSKVFDCLRSHPRVRGASDRPDQEEAPRRPSGREPDLCRDFDATVVDFYYHNDRVDYIPQFLNVWDVVYDKGPDRIMAVAEDLIQKPPEWRKKAPGVSAAPVLPQAAASDKQPDGARRAAPTRRESTSGRMGAAAPTRQERLAKSQQKPGPGSGQFRFRWTHIAANNMEWIEDLILEQIVRRTEAEHPAVSDLVRRSWYEHTGGEEVGEGHVRVTRPLCMRVSSNPVTPRIVHESNEPAKPAEPSDVKKPRRGKPSEPAQGRVEKRGSEPAGTDTKSQQAEREEANKGLPTLQPGKTKGVTDGSGSESDGVCTDKVAIFMPYLTFGRALKPNIAGSKKAFQAVKRDKRLREAYGEEKLHQSQTLDKYYYSSLADTTRRDIDQIVTKYIEDRLKTIEGGRRKQELQQSQKEKESEKSRVASKTEKTEKNWISKLSRFFAFSKQAEQDKGGQTEEESQTDENEIGNDEKTWILRVDQLWLWVVDENNIITSSTNRLDDEADLILESIFNDFYEGNQSGRHPPSSVEKMIQLIMSTVTGFIGQYKVNTLRNRSLESALQIFQNHINDIAEKGATLFGEFQHQISVENETENTSKTLSNGHTNNPYHSINEEIECLVQIRDTIDELNILKSLVESQDHVWKRAFPKEENGQSSDAGSENQTYFIIKELTEMLERAKSVDKSIYDLLDLKQKQANISEAKSSRKQSEETAMQGNTIMVFTLVTIIFLPMSFLASLFALDVTSFPHTGDNLIYSPKWIFSRIFGTTVAISIALIILAFYVNDAIRVWNVWKKEKLKPLLKPRGPSSTPPAQGKNDAPPKKQRTTATALGPPQKPVLPANRPASRPGEQFNDLPRIERGSIGDKGTSRISVSSVTEVSG